MLKRENHSGDTKFQQGAKVGLSKILAIAVIIVFMSTAYVLAAGNAENGAKLANKKCKACHDLTKKKKAKVGPPLFGIVGSPIGSAEGYKKYSKGFAELAGSGVVWDEATLNDFLSNPKTFTKERNVKTKMMFKGVKKENERADIIRYLSTLK